MQKAISYMHGKNECIFLINGRDVDRKPAGVSGISQKRKIVIRGIPNVKRFYTECSGSMGIRILFKYSSGLKITNSFNPYS